MSRLSASHTLTAAMLVAVALITILLVRIAVDLSAIRDDQGRLTCVARAQYLGNESTSAQDVLDCFE